VRPVTCGWPWPRCAATMPGAPPGARSSAPVHRGRRTRRHAVGNILIVGLWELPATPCRAWMGGPALGAHAGCAMSSVPLDLAAGGRGGRSGQAGRDQRGSRPGRCATTPGGYGRCHWCPRTRPPARRLCRRSATRTGWCSGRARGSPACCRTCWCPTWAGALVRTAARRIVVLNLAPQPGRPRVSPRTLTWRYWPATHRSWS